MKTRKSCLVVLVCLLVSSFAFGDPIGQVELKFNSIPLGKNASVYSSGQCLTESIRTGIMELGLNPSYTGTWGVGEDILDQSENDRMLAFCVDIHQDISTSFKTYDILDGPYSLVNEAQAHDLLRLFSNYYDDVVDNDTSSAFQFAVWEIINETSGVYDIYNLETRGSFYTTTSGEFTTIANGWLADLGDVNPQLKLQFFTNPDYQDYGITATVPEPVTAIGMGIGALALLRRTKKTKS